ncbi:MAG: hypothetical protein ACK56F_23820, partial [bacterium]
RKTAFDNIPRLNSSWLAWQRKLTMSIGVCPVCWQTCQFLLAEHSLRHYLLLRLGPRGWFRRHRRKL